MATIITVHGTFAHLGGVPSEEAAPGAEAQWWQRGSATEADIKTLVAGADGPVRMEPFVWNGDNSELERRKAGQALLRRMKALEKDSEPYCVIGHSHGGSVISSALLEAAAYKEPLNGLKQWITVGTPFVKPATGAFAVPAADVAAEGDLRRLAHVVVDVCGLHRRRSVERQWQVRQSELAVTIEHLHHPDEFAVRGILGRLQDPRHAQALLLSPAHHRPGARGFRTALAGAVAQGR